jgi:organic hydroperoxide reductase OsmC/OhrA
MSAEPKGDPIRVELTLSEGYRFEVDFGSPAVPGFEVDEYPPLGQAGGPNPTRMLSAAIGHCLSASLLFCLRKARIEVTDLRAVAEVYLTRNEKGRLRIGDLRVTLAPSVSPKDRDRLTRCLDLFEDFCVVTESVRQGIAVSVTVAPEVSEPQSGVLAPATAPA